MAKKEKAPATPLQIAVSNALSEMGKLHVEMAKEYAHDITDDNRMALEEHATRMLNLQQQMQREKLKANNHKGGWEDMRPAEILFRAEQEMEELRDAVRELMRAQERGARALVPKLRKRVIEEATDVSDFMGFMMHNLTTVGDQMHFLGGNVDRCGLAPTVLADDNVTDNTCDVCGERCPGCDDG